jgi:hypothetical protein
MTEQEFKSRGGEWLGKVREWIQRNCVNGDSVTWGSNDILQHVFTVRDLEELAAEVAFAALQETVELAEIRKGSISFQDNPARANLELIKELEAKGLQPIIDESGWCLGSC